MTVVAPAAGPAAGIDFAIGFAILAGLLVGIGTKLIYDYTIGALLNALARVLKIDAWRIHIDVGGPLRALNNTLQAALGNWILANEQALGKWFHANKVLVEWTYDGIVDFGHDVHSTIAGIVYGEIPAQVQAGTAPLRSKVGAAERTSRARADAEAKARARGIAAEHDYVTGRAQATERGIDAVREDIRTRVMPRIRADERAIAGERAYSHGKLSRRIGLLEKLLGAGALSALVVGALTRVFPYWQCSNVKRAMRGVCRLDRGLLDLLLGVGLEAAVLLNICQAVKVLSATARAFEPELRGLVAVTGAALKCASGDAAGSLGGSLSELPPTARRLPALPV